LTRDTVLEHSEGGVRTLTLNRPEVRNAFNARQYRDLRDALRDAVADDTVRAVILTGAPGAFTAGQDLGEMAAPPKGDGENLFGECMEQVIEFDKPLLAAVNGVGVGLGLTILLHCDLVYVAEGARLRVPFVSLGVVPEAASSYLLPLVVGPQHAAEIFFTADWVSSARAVEIGLAVRELPPDELMPVVREQAAKIAAHPLGALRHTKRLVRVCRLDAVRAARAREDAAFRERIGTPENIEAIRAFFEKREPDFSSLDPS
jgi:enoyl-CoA hydratase/carnithine racemase